VVEIDGGEEAKSVATKEKNRKKAELLSATFP
jgi:hypothetical protein